jgi:acyl-CoA thioester hydrolase
MKAPENAFALRIVVQPEDIDVQDHVNNVTYLKWVQDVAVAHWTTVARPEDQEEVTWVVLRHEIDYRRPALAGDVVIARTWVGQASRLRFDRYTEMTREATGEVLAEARTVWCPVNTRTGRPAVVNAEVRTVFSMEQKEAGD